jgi:hypothetical protein
VFRLIRRTIKNLIEPWSPDQLRKRTCDLEHPGLALYRDIFFMPFSLTTIYFPYL